MSTPTVTVHGSNGRYTCEFSALPGRTFGPWDLIETIQELKISALLSAREARDVVFDAAVNGTATAHTN
ncbi:hypothetical protein [Streptomyces marianii]|uniref:Uncharacterized protein n=1 Tax=Streptomyces marianii TaxID=1817406 RepID=A0A5R9DTX1_9ACTN|nr:hypothetical protein [Streptomyces marianii]TLQ39204.1 hypothetical protein FEF34_38035 [Streptomyces marianii]